MHALHACVDLMWTLLHFDVERFSSAGDAKTANVHPHRSDRQCGSPWSWLFEAVLQRERAGVTRVRMLLDMGSARDIIGLEIA